MKTTMNSPTTKLKPTYQTNDLTLASFLRCRGFQLSNIKENNGRTTFIFEDSPELRTAILDYANDASVSVRTFTNTMRDLKAITR
jgi:hypothetical protein